MLLVSSAGGCHQQPLIARESAAADKRCGTGWRWLSHSGAQHLLWLTQQETQAGMILSGKEHLGADMLRLACAWSSGMDCRRPYIH